MKYWVYKDARILGPFDKDGVAGLPGVDSSTLVCAGESAAAGEGEWRPAGDVSDLAAFTLDRGPAWPSGDVPSAFGLLDKLQIETSGLLADDTYPAAAESLFQDADMRKSFSDVLSARPSVDEAELRRAKNQVVELTTHLELLYKRVAELEAGQTNLVHRLAEKELLLRRQPPPPPPPKLQALLRGAVMPAPIAPTPEPAPIPAPAVSAPVAAALAPAASVPAPAAPMPSPVAAVPPPAPAALAPAPVPVAPAERAPAPAPIAAAPVSISLPAPVKLVAPPALPPASATESAAAPVQPKKPMFERKTFKTARTVKAFRVVGSPELPPAASATPAPAPVRAPESAPAPVPAPVPQAPPEPALPAASVPVPAEKIAPAAPAVTAFDWSAAAPAAGPRPAFAPFPEKEKADSSSPVPPATLAFGGPPAQPAPARASMPVFSGGGVETAGWAATPASIVPTPSFSDAILSPAQPVPARLAKPEPPPPTAAPRAPRSNKPFLIAAASLVVILGIVIFFFLRQPKELKQMAELDDGRSRMGVEPADDAARPPLARPQPLAAAAAPAAAPAAAVAPSAAAVSSEPPSAPAPASEATQAAPQADLDAATAMVKDFPLDGDRVSVGRWLQYSYSGGADAGKESWNASETADKTYLVEYRFTPTARGGAEVHYLFEADMARGFVIGKNLDAQRMLAGSSRGDEEKPKAKAKAKAKAKPKPKKTAPRPATRAKRAENAVPPRDVPLLPLPSEGELRPPSEDDGAFRSDTVGAGSGL